jgi:4,5-DOPA dioxygenase extradiol
MTRFPAVFVSHGAPNLILHESPVREFLAGYGNTLGRPRAIVMISAHFEARNPTLTGDLVPEMIYDFSGFEPELYEMQYPAPGDPALAQRIVELLGISGIKAGIIQNRGFDHGAWVPLKLMYPDADIPVVLLSVQTHLGAQHHLDLGRSLAPLRDEGILVIGSGSLTHNLREFFAGGHSPDADAPEWVTAFQQWVYGKISDDKVEDLVDFQVRAPYARENHPTIEHFLPLFVALGAGGENPSVERVHMSGDHGVLQLDAYQVN